MRRSKTSLASLFFICLIATTSCSDDNSELQTPSTVDTKTWTGDKYMNPNVKPGDNFAMYCWGTWYDNTPLGNETSVGLWESEAYPAVNERMKLSVQQVTQLKTDMSQLAEDAEAINKIKEKIAKLESLKTSKEQAYALGEYLREGNCTYLKGSLTVSDGEFYYVLSNNDILSDILGKNSYQIKQRQDWLRWALIQLGFDEASAKDRVENAIDILPKFSTSTTRSLSDKLNDPAYHESLVSARHSGTRSNESGYEQDLKAFYDGLGIAPEKVIIEENASTILVDMLSCAELGYNDLISVLECGIAADLALASQTAKEKLNTDSDSNYDQYALTNWIGDKLDYTIAKTFCDTYITPSYKQKMKDLMEDLRKTFKSRIENLDWMSSTTKQNAIDKLQKMTFHVASPDTWCQEGIPQLEGKSLYEDMLLLRKSQHDMRRALLDKHPKDELASFAYLEGISVSTLNAFYFSPCNSLLILPNIILKPFYDESESEAKLYALSYVFGHEITHGFDNNGAKFDVDGNMKEWWTVSDQIAFNKKTELLVNCYNHLPVYVGSSEEYVNGEKTLGENIADLGGLEIAHQTYVEKLKEQGYYGDELIKQEKKFYQSFAEIWRGKYTKRYLQNLNKSDEHANNITRINGITMNCDRWYELYDVKWGDTNYLSPEQRTKIW